MRNICPYCAFCFRKINSKYQCLECEKTFSQDEVDDLNSFLEKLTWACRERGWTITHNSLPTLDWPQVVKERREYWDNNKPLEDIIRGCQGMIRSYKPIEKERVRILAKALGDTFKRQYEQSRQDLIDLIQNNHSYNESDLLEICLAVSWEKSKDAKGGNERLASIMTRGARIDYGDSTLTELYELSPSSFRQRMYRNRNKAKEFDFHDVIPPDYWRLFVGDSWSDINEVIDILGTE